MSHAPFIVGAYVVAFVGLAGLVLFSLLDRRKVRREIAERGDRAAAILEVVGVINLPIIKFSVDWWNTLHQPASVARLGGPAIDAAILLPPLWMAGSFLLLFILLVLVRTETEMDRRRLENAESKV